MSAFGKILAVLNLLAGAAAVYLALADFAVRQRWSYGVYRLDLMLDGLPVNQQQADMEGHPRLARLSDGAVQDILQPVGGVAGSPSDPDSKTQVGELRRVREKVLGEINSLTDESAKRQKLAQILLPLCRSFPEREAWAKEIQTAPIAQLTGPQGLLEKQFNEAIENKDAQGQDRGAVAQHDAIAHLLYTLATDETARKRVAAIVGLRQYAREADRQAAAYRAMTDNMQLVLNADRMQYEKEHRQIEGELALLQDTLKLKNQELESYRQELDRHRMLLKAREADVKEIVQDLEKARQQTKLALANLTAEQQRLFAAEQRVRQGIASNLGLERQISRIENVQP